MILKRGVKRLRCLSIVLGMVVSQSWTLASSFGYVPYSYRVSTQDENITTPSFEDFEDNILFVELDSKLLTDILSFEDSFEDKNSSTPPIVNLILDSAMSIYTLESNLSDTNRTTEINFAQLLKSISSSQLPESDSIPKNIEQNITKKRSTTPSKILYEVKRGDSFIKLAKDFNTTVFDIKRWNRIKKRDIVRLGEKLVIHPNRKTPYEKIREIIKLESYGRYRVEAGDTLSSIVRKFAVGKKETKRINHLKDGNSIRVGQKLIIPLSQKKIDMVLKRIEAKKRAKRLALERKRKLEMARKGRYKIRKGKHGFKRRIRVVATAYTSHRSQTDRTPFLAAWNNRIRPGMKIIAVSNDLIRRYGITNGTRVKISGLPGVYVVRDKMHPRLRNHIDIYMGTNLGRALRWGRRRVILYW